MKTIANRLLFALFLLFGCFTAVAQQTIPVGIIVVRDINSDDPYLLSHSAVVSSDVYYNGNILIAAGTTVNMDIHYQKRHGLGVPATVSVKPVSTTDIYGQVWPLVGDERTVTGQNRRNAAIGCGVFFGIVTFPVGLLFLCIKGKRAEFAAGTQMIANLYIN